MANTDLNFVFKWKINIPNSAILLENGGEGRLTTPPV